MSSVTITTTTTAEVSHLDMRLPEPSTVAEVSRELKEKSSFFDPMRCVWTMGIESGGRELQLEPEEDNQALANFIEIFLHLNRTSDQVELPKTLDHFYRINSLSADLIITASKGLIDPDCARQTFGTLKSQYFGEFWSAKDKSQVDDFLTELKAIIAESTFDQQNARQRFEFIKRKYPKDMTFDGPHEKRNITSELYIVLVEAALNDTEAKKDFEKLKKDFFNPDTGLWRNRSEGSCFLTRVQLLPLIIQLYLEKLGPPTFNQERPPLPKLQDV